MDNLFTWYTTSQQTNIPETKPETTARKNCLTQKIHTFTPLIRRVNNLFKQTNLKVAFRTINTIQQQLSEKQAYKDPCGIYKLKCNTCNGVYFGESGRAINVRYREHKIYKNK
jgi:hypothetical protein